MKVFKYLSRKIALGLSLALMLSLLAATIVLADQIVNNIDTTIDPALETRTITAGGSTSVGFYIQPSNTIPAGDANGCNATGANPATVTLGVPTGVSASPTSLTFTGCGTPQNITFSSSTAGSHTISIASVSGGKSDSLWDTAPASFTLVVNPPQDSTPPVITPFVVGTPGNDGWYVSDVDVSWTVSDPESAISSTTGCNPASDPISITADNAGDTLTCTATSTGGISSQSVTIKRDATAPTISGSASPAPNSAGWNNTDVTVSFTCGDNLSGVASCGPGQTLSSEGAGQSASGTAVDNAGNSASATVVGINIDKTPPTVAPVVSPNPVILNGSASIAPNASDSPSGVASGIASVSCGALDTSSVGLKSVSCSAIDYADNSATVSAIYRVIYNWNSFFRPVDSLPTFNQVKAGSAIPIKFSLSGNQGLNIFPAGYPKSVFVNCDANSPVDNIEETVNAVGSSLSYDPVADQYVYVWKTDKTWSGTCRQFVIQLNDGMEYRANFKFTK